MSAKEVVNTSQGHPQTSGAGEDEYFDDVRQRLGEVAQILERPGFLAQCRRLTARLADRQQCNDVMPDAVNWLGANSNSGEDGRFLTVERCKTVQLRPFHWHNGDVTAAQQLPSLDEREDVQKKTFTKWINSQLSKAGRAVIEDLTTDLRDGTVLLSLLEALSGMALQPEKGRLRVHHINNVNQVVSLLETKYHVKLVNISSNDIVDGNVKLTLGLVWSIILHWQVKDVMQDLAGDLRQTNLEKTLLTWCQTNTAGYESVFITNFTSSWRDGLAFNALLHHYRPDLFDYRSLLAHDSQYRLNQAFQLAEQQLGVVRLLDAEDVMVLTPDKKSIMTYLMCMFQVLHHSAITSPVDITVPSLVSHKTRSSSSQLAAITAPGAQKTESVMSMSSESGPSMASSGSVELLSYQDALETVLTWLLEAEEVMDKQAPIGPDVQTVKNQFNQHEEFMLELTQHQDSIGAVLHDGNELITEGRLTAEEEHEIHVQMDLLNNRWEDLRIKALDRQAKLQEVLMDLQQQQLDSLAQWLTGMEERMNKEQPVGADLEAIKKQVEEHKLIQQSLEEQQKRVDSLQHMVVVVDDSNADSGAACVAMEKQLERLGWRWAAVCRWTEEQWVMLQEVLLRWQQFADEQTKFSVWLTEKESVLTRMAHADLSDPDQVIMQVKHLKAIENDMGEQVRRFDALNECGQHIVRYVDNQTAVSHIAALLENLQERWEKLVEMMEQQSTQIASSGVELSRISELYNTEREGREDKGDRHPPSPLSSFGKKRKMESAQRIEFEMQLKALNEWFASTESTLQLLVSESSQEPFTVEEQRVLIQDAENSIRSHQIDVQRVVTLGKGVITELKIVGVPYDSTAAVIQQLEDRWEQVNKVLLETRPVVDCNFESSKFHSELAVLQELLASYQKWLSTTDTIAHEAQEISKQLDQCKVKLRAMQAHQDRVEHLKLHGEQIIRQFRACQTISDDLHNFMQRWQKIFNKIEERQVQLVEALEKAPPRSYLEAMAVLMKRLQELESVIQTEKVQMGSRKFLNRKLAIYKDMKRDMEDHMANKEYINKMGHELIARSQPDRASVLEADLSSLNSRWLAASTLIEQRQARLEKALSQINDYQMQVEGLNKWMDEMDVFLHTEDPVTGDLPALQAQIQESKGVQEDVKTLQHNVKSINSIAKSFMEDSDPDFKAELKQEVSSLNERWEQVVSLAREQDQRLTCRLSSSRGVYDQIQALCQWLMTLKQDLAHKDYSVDSPNDLQVKWKKFQSLKKEVNEREAEVNKVNSEVNSMLNSAPTGSLQELARCLLRMNSLWADVTQRVDRYAALYHNSQLQWREFTDLVEKERQFLANLERNVRRSSATSSDAEDISEELNEIETLLQHHKQENKQRVQELAGELTSNSIMPELVQRELTDFLSKLDSLQDEAKSKMSRLELSIQKAQTTELQILNMSQWMGEMGQHLQSHLDADLLAGDLPQEHQTLKEEFNQQEALLKELEDRVIQYRQQGKMEASARLEQQTQLLKKHFAQVAIKFRKFQRPAEFEPKLNHVKRELERIQDTIHLLEVTSASPTAIQERHDACMKHYKTMSELKPEVEYVIKTGRQVVEHKQVDFPDKVNMQLDAIKQLYNDLGAQVTESKAKLDKGIKLARKLQREIVQLTDFITQTAVQLSKRQSAHSPNVDEQLAYVQTVLEEMQSREVSLKTAHELIQQIQALAEETDVSDFQQQLCDINQNWTDLSLSLTNFTDMLHAEDTSLDSQFINFQSQMLKVKDWLGRSENILASHSRLSDSQQMSSPHTETIKQTLLLQMNEMKSQVDEVRDLAIMLMSQSHRFTPMVEPELTHLNQRWEEVAHLLKAKQNQQQEVKMTAASSPKISSPQSTRVRTSPPVSESIRVRTSPPVSESIRVRTSPPVSESIRVRTSPPVSESIRVRTSPPVSESTRVRTSPPVPESIRVRTSPPVSESIRGQMEGEGEFRAACQHVREKMAAFESATSTQGKLMDSDLTDNIEANMQLIDEEANMLKEEIDEVMKQGEQLMLRAENCRDPSTHAYVNKCLQDIKTQWADIQRDTTTKWEALMDIAPHWYEFSHLDQDLVLWLDSMEQQLNKTAISDLEAFEDEVRQRRKDLETLQTAAQTLTERGAGSVVEPEVKRLNQRWQDLSSQLAHCKASSIGPGISASITSSDSTNVLFTSQAEGAKCNPPADTCLLQEVLSLLGQILQLQQRLSSWQLNWEDTVQLHDHELQLKEMDEQMTGLREAVSRVEEEVRSLPSTDEQVSSELQEVCSKLCSQWALLNATYQRLMKAMEQWWGFHNDMQELDTWLDEAEEKLKVIKNSDEGDDAISTLVALESGMRVQQGTVNSMNAAGNEIVRQRADTDTQRLKHHQEDINRRWEALCSQLFERQKYSGRREEGSIKTSEFTDEMDELFFWIDETENILGSTLKLDPQYLTDLLEKIKDREEDIASRQQCINDINAHGNKMAFQETLSSEDKSNIQRDLLNLNQRWTQVTGYIPQFVQKVEEELRQLNYLLEETKSIQTWLQMTKELLETKVALPSSTDHTGSVVDPQSVQFALQTRQVNMGRINSTYQRLSEVVEVEVPDTLREQVAAVNSGWEEVNQLANCLHIAGQSQVTFSVNTREQEKSSPVQTALASPLAFAVTTSTASSTSCASKKQREFSGAVRELQEWLLLLNNLLLSHTVTVCNQQEVQQMLHSHMSLLDDMEKRHPRLEEVAALSEQLQQSAENDSDRTTLKQQVIRLQKDWHNARKGAAQRVSQLQKMLQACQQFHQTYADLEQWLGQVEADLDARPIRPHSSQHVDTLLRQHEALQEDVNKRQTIVDELERQAGAILEDYKKDDTHNIDLQLKRLINRWSCLLNRYESDSDGTNSDQDYQQHRGRFPGMNYAVDEEK